MLLGKMTDLVAPEEIIPKKKIDLRRKKNLKEKNASRRNQSKSQKNQKKQLLPTYLLLFQKKMTKLDKYLLSIFFGVLAGSQ